jgi:hypothetical protein
MALHHSVGNGFAFGPNDLPRLASNGAARVALPRTCMRCLVDTQWRALLRPSIRLARLSLCPQLPYPRSRSTACVGTTHRPSSTIVSCLRRALQRARAVPRQRTRAVLDSVLAPRSATRSRCARQRARARSKTCSRRARRRARSALDSVLAPRSTARARAALDSMLAPRTATLNSVFAPCLDSVLAPRSAAACSRPCSTVYSHRARRRARAALNSVLVACSTACSRHAQQRACAALNSVLAPRSTACSCPARAQWCASFVSTEPSSTTL